MKKLTLCLLIGALAATAVLSGCSTSKSSSAASNGDTSKITESYDSGVITITNP